jgi:hypothetical protein
LRPAMRSPGRPEPSRAVQRAFWRQFPVRAEPGWVCWASVEEPLVIATGSYCSSSPRAAVGHRFRESLHHSGSGIPCCVGAGWETSDIGWCSRPRPSCRPASRSSTEPLRSVVARRELLSASDD